MKVYKAKKLNPMKFKDSKAEEQIAKKALREENNTKHKLSKSNYIKMLREEADDRPEEVVGLAGL